MILYSFLDFLLNTFLNHLVCYNSLRGENRFKQLYVSILPGSRVDVIWNWFWIGSGIKFSRTCRVPFDLIRCCSLCLAYSFLGSSYKLIFLKIVKGTTFQNLVQKPTCQTQTHVSSQLSITLNTCSQLAPHSDS